MRILFLTQVWPCPLDAGPTVRACYVLARRDVGFLRLAHGRAGMPGGVGADERRSRGAVGLGSGGAEEPRSRGAEEQGARGRPSI